MKDAAEGFLLASSNGNQTAPTASAIPPSKWDIRLCQDKLRQVLESGDERATQGLTACLDAMIALIQMNKEVPNDRPT
jgi:hypothetical protein